jgi:hypothetical protein
MPHSVQGQFGPISFGTWRCAVGIGLALTAVSCPPAAARAMLGKDFDGIFALVRAGSCEQVSALLPAMSADADKVLAGKAGEPPQAAIREASKLAERAWGGSPGGWNARPTAGDGPRAFPTRAATLLHTADS